MAAPDPRSFPFLDIDGVIAMAHRGGDSVHAENTMAAFEHAIDLGYFYVETDVHTSADEVLYAFHDEDLERVTGRKEKLSELKSSQLDALRFGPNREYSIPRLEELVSSWPDVRVNIDPKSDAAAPPLVKLVQQQTLLDRICIGSFSDRRVAWCRRQLGEGLCTSMGRKESLRLRMAAFGLPTGPFTSPCAQTPYGYYTEVFGQPIGLPFTTPRMIEKAHEQGLNAQAWTVNEADMMHYLLDHGIDGIMTDDCELLKSVLVERGLWRTGP